MSSNSNKRVLILAILTNLLKKAPLKESDTDALVISGRCISSNYTISHNEDGNIKGVLYGIKIPHLDEFYAQFHQKMSHMARMFNPAIRRGNLYLRKCSIDL